MSGIVKTGIEIELIESLREEIRLERKVGEWHSEQMQKENVEFCFVSQAPMWPEYSRAADRFNEARRKFAETITD